MRLVPNVGKLPALNPMNTILPRIFQRSLRRLSALALVSFVGPAAAGDLFTLNGNTTDAGVPITFNEGSSKLPSFISDLVSGSNQFDALNNRQFAASLRYADVANALNFNIRQVGTTWRADLTSPFQPGLINRSFNTASRAELDNAIEDYLKKDGSGDLARFLAAINKKSGVAGVLDGNPNSATAQIANQSFMEYGLRPTETAEMVEGNEDGNGSDTTSRTGFSMTADVGTFRSQGIEGQSYSWTPMIPWTIGKARRVRLELALPINYTQIEGADQYRVGSQLGVAVLVVKRTKTQPWLWQVTPQGGVTVAGSADMIAGGVLLSGGVTSYTSYRWNSWEFSMGNHISFHEGLRVSVDDYTFDPQISQQIVKNGLKIGRSLGQRWYAEVYALDTEFVQAAYTSRFTTVGAGVGYRGMKRKGYMMLGTYMDFGPGYQSAHAQFGTGWKF